MDVEFDPAKAISNQRKHGVSFAHAEQALHDDLAVTIEIRTPRVSNGLSPWAWTPSDVFWLWFTHQEGTACALFQRARPVMANWSNTMRKEYDFSKGKRGAVAPSVGKTRITIMLDDDVIEFFRSKSEAAGTGYQTLINKALKSLMDQTDSADTEPLTASRLREILREELHTA